jgi:DNA-binding NarL/FixJ family response regulator
VSGHPLLTRAVERILARIKTISLRALPPAANETRALSRGSEPALFVLDACSLRGDLGPIAARFRGNLPGSKFLALLPPNTPISEQIRLFYWGIDGFLELGRTWQAELPKAIERLVRGQMWVPREVLLAFVSHAQALLSTQLARGNFLTAREGQVLQLLLRRLTNKEISSALGISERTAKFHVSNILSKLQLDDRRSLFPDRSGFTLLTPPRSAT